MSLTAADQQERGTTFRALHGKTFVIPNPWDAGSARLLAGLGFPALATTSAGLAFSLGRPDGANQLSRDEVLRNAADIVAATPLPVSADLESGFGDTPAEVAATITAAAGAGLVGGSVEDATGEPAAPIRPLAEAVARVAAAAEAARALPFAFTLTARAENFLYGRPDLPDTIARLRAFQDAGADVLYAPALPDLAAVRAVCAAVSRPVNVLAGPRLSVPELAGAGVARISLGSALHRASYGALVRAAREVAGDGTFTFAADAYGYAEANTFMSTGESP